MNAAIERQILLKTDQDDFIKPLAIARTTDGEFVVAGTASDLAAGAGLGHSWRTAWAAGLDERGQKLWEYRANYSKDPGAISNPEFRGVVTSLNGTIYLCGQVDRPVRSGLPSALLTHLDAKGHLIEEHLFTPFGKPQSSNVSSSIDGCIRWGNDIVIVGHVLNVIRTGGQPGGPAYETSYWITVLEPSGKIKWEKTIPVNLGGRHGSSYSYIDLSENDDKLVLLSTNSRDTEVTRLRSTGEIEAQVEISGYYRLVQSMSTDSTIQLAGPQREGNPQVFVTLDRKLRETTRAERDFEFFGLFKYRTEGGSLIFFGRDQGYRALGAIADIELHLQQRIDLEDKQVDVEGLSNSAATPTGKADELLLVASCQNWSYKKVVAKGGDESLHKAYTINTKNQGIIEFKTGLLLNFLKIQ